MASSSASRNQPQKESFSDDDEDAGDFELIVTVKKVLLAFLRVKKVNLKFIQAKFPGNVHLHTSLILKFLSKYCISASQLLVI